MTQDTNAERLATSAPYKVGDALERGSAVQCVLSRISRGDTNVLEKTCVFYPRLNSLSLRP